MASGGRHIIAMPAAMINLLVIWIVERSGRNNRASVLI